MLFLAMVSGIAVLVWFYLTATHHNQNAIQWAIIGFIGYWFAWWAIKLTVLKVLVGFFLKSVMGTFMVVQIPALCGLVTAYFIRRKLLSDITTNNRTTDDNL